MLWLWTALGVLMVALIVVEALLLRFGKHDRTPGEALTSLVFWIVSAVLGFAAMIYYVYETNWRVVQQALMNVAPSLGAPRDAQGLSGTDALTQFLTAYATELTLSLDNVAVLAVLFAYYKIPSWLVSRVLFMAILISLVLRLALVLLGAELLASYSWFVYVFVGLLFVAMLRTLLLPDERTDFNARWITRVIGRFVPIAPGPDGARWFTQVQGRLAITPLLLCIIVAGAADLTYAADSIPAVFSITQDPFLAFASQAMVILSLRSLYFAVAPVLGRLRYLKVTLVFLMGYIVVKTIFFRTSQVATEVTLGVVIGALLVAVTGSLLGARGRQVLDPRPSPLEDIADAALATKRNFRKVMILIAGTAIIILAIIIAPLPGPGLSILLPVGVALLATEFVWAKTLFDRGKVIALRVTKRSDSVSRSLPRWVVIPVLLGFYGFWVCVYFGWWSDFYFHIPPKAVKGFAVATASGLSFPVLGWAYRLVRRLGQANPAGMPTPAPKDAADGP